MPIILRFYEELNDFLPAKHRKQSYAVPHPEPRSVKDLIEAQGVPHTEVDLILINGQPVSFDAAVSDGDRVAVYPTFESFDIASTSGLDRPPLRRPRFVADVHLGKLVRRLRLLGFDCRYNPDWDDEQLATISASETRVLLTRDVGLLKRAIVTHGVFLHSDDPTEQMREVIRRLDLKTLIQPLSRCLTCNGALKSAVKKEVASVVPAKTLQHVNHYLQCTNCGKVYWKGTHWGRLKHIIEQARNA